MKIIHADARSDLEIGAYALEAFHLAQHGRTLVFVKEDGLSLETCSVTDSDGDAWSMSEAILQVFRDHPPSFMSADQVRETAGKIALHQRELLAG